MRKWTRQDYRTMPWKNGGGSTTELAIFPEDAKLDHFIWRLSTASVNMAGPFSHFSQTDRTLAILSGAGLVLHTDESTHAPAASVTLERTTAPHRFLGEMPIHATLIDDPVVDLNMMTRRDVCQHHMQRLGEGSHFVSAADAQQVLLYCANGEAVLRSGEVITQGDLVLFEEDHERTGVTLEFSAHTDAEVYLITIHFLAER